MRLALAQINTVVGDLDGNRERILDAARRGARARRRPRPLPRAGRHRLPARGSPAPARLLPRRGALARRDRARRGDHRAGRYAALRPRPLQRLRGVRGRRGEGVYRKRFLPNYGVFDEDRYFAPGRDLFLLEHGDDADRADDLRGRLAAGPARDRPGPRRGAADRQPLGVAVPRRQGARAGGDARHARARQRRASSRS